MFGKHVGVERRHEGSIPLLSAVMEETKEHYKKGAFRVVDASTGGFRVERFISFQTRHWDCLITIGDGPTVSTVPKSYWALWGMTDTLEEAVRIADIGLGVSPLYYWSKWP